MRIPVTLRAAAALAALLATPAAFAAGIDTMSCTNGIVSTGDTVGVLFAKCGQPTYSAQREDKRVTGSGVKGGTKIISSVAVDDMLYNFGPDRFQYRVVVENGIVRKLESLDYGY